MSKFFILINILLLSISSSSAQNVNDTSKNTESYKSFVFDGAWCWFSDPRAIYYKGKFERTYAGWVNSYGDILIGYYDHVTKEIKTSLLHDNFEVDDHDNPALFIDKEGKLYVFYSKHSNRSGESYPIQLIISKKQEDISDWESPIELKLNDMERYAGMKDSYTYPNPVYLSNEDKFYLFWRGADFKPNISTSVDKNLKEWSKGKIFVLPERIYANRRPYLKVFSKGKSRIHFAFTDGLPRSEEDNSIYYMYYENGFLHKANGEKIKELDDIPVAPNEAQIVYDASISKKRAWIWDVAEDEKGFPVVVYTKFKDTENHILSYARWNGTEWNNYDLVNSGKWFPENERADYYSGGIVIDKEDPSIVYLSVLRDEVFEIEKWITNDFGKTWSIEEITRGSSKDNVRPFAILNASNENQLQILWMTNTKYDFYDDYQTSIQTNLRYFSTENIFEPKNILNTMNKVADWQLMNPMQYHKLNWHYSAFYIGLLSLYKSSHEVRYLNEVMNIGDKYNWKILNDIFNADRLAIGQAYSDLYMIKKDPVMIEKIQWVLDMHIDRKIESDVQFANNPYKKEWWSWCDALFMAPPTFAQVYAITKDDKYLKYLNEHWWKTSDYLYSKDDSLFFRDDRFKNPNDNQKVFWGRGNGWVIAGLSRVIKNLPTDYPNRSSYEQQFIEMSYKLLSLQKENGMWESDLYKLEDKSKGESSGTAFITYALAWGVNNDILPSEDFVESIKKSWISLNENINSEGKLGFVQPIGFTPKDYNEEDYHLYGTGAFLLAGSEIFKLFNSEIY